MLTGSCSGVKKVICRITIVMMLALAFTGVGLSGASFSYALDKVVKVQASSLILRSGAGTSYKKLTSLPKGTCRVVAGSKKDSKGTVWYKVSYDSKTGYISSDYVDVISLSVTKLSGLQGKISASGKSVAARNGPGTIYTKVYSLKDGTSFTITGKAKDVNGQLWYRFIRSGSEVFVYSGKVKTSKITKSSSTTKSSSSSSSATSTTASLKGTVNISSGSLNVRSGPGTEYDVLGSLAKGKTFTIKGQKKSTAGLVWYSLDFSGKTGYVASSYIKTSTGSASSSSTSATKATSTTSSGSKYTIGVVDGSSVNVRSGAGVTYKKLGQLSDGSIITINGSAKASNGVKWYKFKYNSKTAYICSSYVIAKTVKTDAAFEKEMTKQGFPASYKPGLRLIHAIHPKWKIKGYKVGISWSTALSAQTKSPGINVLESSEPKSYRSKVKGAYNSKTKKWTIFDGRWYAASKTVVAHYMDPRNFINEKGIYQFMTHKYDASSQNAATVRAVVKGSFMETRATGNSKYPKYPELINAAGKASDVNPNVIAAMIYQEQGSRGASGLISGKYSGYKGYYNFFNIGAYTTSSMSAVQRGLWYAKQSGSYGRPWNSVYKSITGGAKFYASNYVNAKQDTYYYKKFNVKNGASRIGVHQYMTKVSAAAEEGRILRKGFKENMSYAAVIEIPIYNNMPSSPVKLP